MGQPEQPPSSPPTPEPPWHLISEAHLDLLEDVERGSHARGERKPLLVTAMLGHLHACGLVIPRFDPIPGCHLPGRPGPPIPDAFMPVHAITPAGTERVAERRRARELAAATGGDR